MKRTAFFLAILLLFSLCACTLRETRPYTVPKEQTNTKPLFPRLGNQTAAPTTEPAPAPASGTDLEIPEPMSEAADAALAQLRQSILDADAVCGLAFIGYVEPNMTIAESVAATEVLRERGYAERFPFIAELTPRQCAGNGRSELYCLVPQCAGALVILERAETAAGEPVAPYTEFYRSTSGDPVLFAADSNGWGGSDVIVTVKDAQGRELRCNPGLLSNPGTLAPINDVADFTIAPEDGF